MEEQGGNGEAEEGAVRGRYSHVNQVVWIGCYSRLWMNIYVIIISNIITIIITVNINIIGGCSGG